jgi:hypothetical protein
MGPWRAACNERVWGLFDTGLGIMIKEIHAQDMTVDKDQRSSAMLQAATKEFVNKWAIQENPNK